MKQKYRVVRIATISESLTQSEAYNKITSRPNAVCAFICITGLYAVYKTTN